MDDHNPWATAASQKENSGRVSDPKNQSARRWNSDDQESPRSFGTSLLRVWLSTDALVGLLLLVYSVILIKGSSSVHVRTVITLSIFIGSLLFLRGSLGLVGIRFPQVHSCGTRWNVNFLSPLILATLLILSILCGALHAKVFLYLANHANTLHLSRRVWLFLDSHHHALWVTLLGLFGLELIRWIGTRRWMVLQQDERLELLLTPPRSRLDSRNRPWWWRKRRNHETTLQDPLLLVDGQPHWTSTQDDSYIMNEGIHNTTQDSIWSRLRGGLGFSPSSSRRQDTTRDDGSVDFESVQEEWASRSEEDPLWWSREEEDLSQVDK